jgi:outer membrane receptor protein involved in Fe transport
VFQEDWTNLQSTIALNQYSPDCGGNFITNAGAARVDGTEIEARTNLNDHFSLYATGQYQYSRIVSVEAGSAGTVGAPLQSAPRLQLASGLAYEVTPIKDWDTTARIDYAYVGARNMSNTNTPVDPNYQLPGYSTVNLRLEVTHEGWAFTGYINNLTDSVPQLGVQVFPGGPGNYTGGFAPGLLRQVTTGPPRVVGILVRKEF